jgi:hypothetical protein
MPVISHPPSRRQTNLLQGNQVSRFEYSFDETLGTCRATILQPHSTCTRHSAQGLCERGKKSVPEGSHDKIIMLSNTMSVKSNSAGVSAFFHLRTETEPSAETLRYFLNMRRRTKFRYLASLRRKQEDRTQDELILASAWSW